MSKFGLLGYKLGHSYSKIIHEEIYHKNNLEHQYDLLEIEENEIPKFLDLLRNGIYSGYNVTIPYKEKVIPYLDELSIAAKEINAVNTIYLKDGKLIGDNTDYYGFIKELEYYNLDIFGLEVYILGTGGAAKAIFYAVKELGGIPIFVSRSKEKGISYQELSLKGKIPFIVNTTPLGMYPNVYESPLDKTTLDKVNAVVDIIFNPPVTKLLSYAKKGYNGELMLIFQAIKACKLWFNDEINYDVDEIIKKIESRNK